MCCIRMKFKKKNDFSKMSQNVFWVTNGLGASKRWILVWFELSLLWWSQVVLKFNIFYSFLLYFLLTDSNVIVEEMMHRFWSLLLIVTFFQGKHHYWCTVWSSLTYCSYAASVLVLLFWIYIIVYEAFALRVLCITK